MRIRYRGFKDNHGDYDLGRAVLLQGDIGSGKSSLVAAAHFALVGKVAAMRLGKGDTQDPGRLLKIAEDGAFAEVTLGEVVVNRRLEATPKKARVLTTVNGKVGPEAESKAAELAGDLIFADFGRLVAAGDTERAAILATYLPQPADDEKRLWTMGQAFCHMEAAISPGAKKGKPNEPRIAGRLKKDDAKALRDKLVTLAEIHGSAVALTEIFEVMKRPNVTGDALVQLLREAANAAEETRKTANKVAEEAAKANASEIGLAAEVPALEEQASQARSEVRHAASIWETWNSRQQMIATTQERLEKIGTLLADLQPYDSSLESADAALAAANAALEALNRSAPVKPDLSAMRTLEVEVQNIQNAARDAANGQAALASWEMQIQTFEAELAGLEDHKPVEPTTDLEIARETEAMLAKAIETAINEGKPKIQQYHTAKTNECPLMHIECPGSLLEFAETTKSELDDLGKRVARLNQELATVRQSRLEAEDEHRQFEVAMTSWTRQKNGVDAKLQHAIEQRNLARSVATDSAAIEARLVPMVRELQLLRQRQDDYAGASTKWQTSRGAAQEKALAATTTRERCVNARSRTAELKSEEARLNIGLAQLLESQTEEPQGPDPEALEALDARLQQAHAAKARVDVMASVNVDGKTACATLWKAAHAGAAAGLVACIQNATDPIVGKISTSLERMGLHGTFFVDLEAKTFGIFKKDKLIDVETLSGGEKVLFAAAMLSALPRRSGTRVLTLESAELPGKWLARLLAGLDIEAFDSVIVASCHVPTSVPAGWKVITMEGGAA